MNPDQGLSALRWLLSVAGSYVLASGKIDGVMWAQISTAILTLAPVVWSMFVHTDTAKVQAAAAVPGVQSIQIGQTAEPALKKMAEPVSTPSNVVAAPVYTSAQRR